MGTLTVPRVVDAVDRVCRTAATGDDLFEDLSHELAKAIPFDGSGWFGIDPTTLLAVAPARVEHLDSGYCQVFWHGEFHDQDVALFRDLARSALPAASLHAATGHRPLRSARYRDFLHPQGYEDELRVAFRTGASTWAIAALYREKGRPPFETAEIALMAAISEVVGSAVRLRAAMGGPAVPPLSPAPGRASRGDSLVQRGRPHTLTAGSSDQPLPNPNTTLEPIPAALPTNTSTRPHETSKRGLTTKRNSIGTTSHYGDAALLTARSVLL